MLRLCLSCECERIIGCIETLVCELICFHESFLFIYFGDVCVSYEVWLILL